MHTETRGEHLVILQKLFQRLSDANLTARQTKCIIASNSIDVVGHRVPEGVKGLQYVENQEPASKPKTKKEVRAFVRFDRLSA